jgi:hypothetical protein
MHQASFLAMAAVGIVAMGMSVKAAEPLPPITKVEIVSQEQGFKVNGQPFFPIMSWAQKPTAERFKMLRGLGINTFCGDQKGATVQCEVAKEAGGYAIAHWKGEAVSPYLLAWIQGDEPDMPRKDDGGIWVPKAGRSVKEVIELYKKLKAADKTRPVLVTFTAHFMKEQRSRYTEAQQKELYSGFVNAADVIGFDTYPIYGSGHPSHLNWPAYGTEQLCAYAGSKRPVYAWIETHKGSRWMTYSKQPDVLPKHTRFEVWGCIIRGATAIGYFTHAWRPKFTEFAPTKDMQAELKRLNTQITRLAPDILAPPAKAKVQMTIAGGLPCHVKATQTSSQIFIIAQIIDLGPDGEKKKQFQPVSPRGGKATFKVPGLKAGASIEVVDENRTIKAQAGGFTDDFGPLGEHLYRIGK